MTMTEKQVKNYNEHALFLADIAKAVLGGNRNVLDVNGVKEIIALYLMIPYMSSSTLDCQLSLFNEAEAEMNPDAQEPLIERKGCIYKRKTKTTREELLKDLPIEEVPCMLHPDDMFCDQCGSSLREIGYVKVRDELEYIPAKVNSVARVMYQKYVNGIPLYRQEKDWEQVGIGLSRATMDKAYSERENLSGKRWTIF